MDFLITPLAIFQQLGPLEIFLIFFVILLLFGAKRLPELFRSFGKSLKEFKKATSEIEEEVNSAVESADVRKSTHTPKEKPLSPTPEAKPKEENTNPEPSTPR